MGQPPHGGEKGWSTSEATERTVSVQVNTRKHEKNRVVTEASRGSPHGRGRASSAAPANCGGRAIIGRRIIAVVLVSTAVGLRGRICGQNAAVRSRVGGCGVG